MLVVETIAGIRRNHLVRGIPTKTLAWDLRVSKKTVRKIQPIWMLGSWTGELECRLEANW